MGKMSNLWWWAFIINSSVNRFYNFIILTFLNGFVCAFLGVEFFSLLFWQLDDAKHSINGIWNEKWKRIEFIWLFDCFFTYAEKFWLWVKTKTDPGDLNNNNFSQQIRIFKLFPFCLISEGTLNLWVLFYDLLTLRVLYAFQSFLMKSGTNMTLLNPKSWQFILARKLNHVSLTITMTSRPLLMNRLQIMAKNLSRAAL